MSSDEEEILRAVQNIVTALTTEMDEIKFQLGAVKVRVFSLEKQLTDLVVKGKINIQ